MPAPLGKFAITLFAIVAAVRLPTAAADPGRLMLMPLPFEVAVDVELVIVLLEMLALVIVPLPLRRCTPLKSAFDSVLPVMVTLPEMLFSLPAVIVLKAMFESSAPPPVPELLIVPFVKLKFTTPVPFTPLLAVLWIFTLLNDGESVLVSRTPSLVMF